MALPAALAAAGPIASGLFGLIDQLFTSDDERMAAKLKMLELEQQGKLAQIAVNANEAQHTSLFVAGWRPFIGWVCGFSFAWACLLYPFMTFVVVTAGIPVPLELIPALDLSAMLPVLMGMLGLGAMRSYEKQKGVSRETWEPRSGGGVDRRANGG